MNDSVNYPILQDMMDALEKARQHFEELDPTVVNIKTLVELAGHIAKAKGIVKSMGTFN